jgi:type 1 glutamine amidotransferase
MRKLTGLYVLSALACLGALELAPAQAADAKIVLIAGKPSHGPGAHEFNAGTKLLVKCLKEIPGIDPVFVAGGWPEDESVFQGARAVVFFMDGGKGHPMIQGERLKTMRRLMDQGVGLACLHYAVEVPKGEPGDAFLEWLGGYYETGFSTNPHWTAEVKSLPDHPITRGVRPFTILDEWYFNIRFRPEMKGVTPIVVARPSDETRQGVSSSPRGPYPHIEAARGREEVLGWAVERPDGGRSFGFTGAHFHTNWGNPDFRTLVLNAILWTAKVNVPSGGAPSSVTEEELKQNLDPKPAPKAKAAAKKKAA